MSIELDGHHCPSAWLARMLPMFVMLLSLQSGLSYADSTYELQLIHPDAQVSSQPFVEFRSRKYDLDPRRNEDVFAERFSVGHGFVLLGRVLDDGTLFYHTVGGFYPESDSATRAQDSAALPNSTTVRTAEGTRRALQSIRSTVNVLYGPGEVTYRLPDLSYDQVFRAPITTHQEILAQRVLMNWDDKNYALIGRNCANLVADVARVVGLDPGPRHLIVDTPWKVLETLRAQSTVDKPFRSGLEQRTTNQRERVRVNKDIYSRERERYEKQKQLQYEQRLRESLQQTFRRPSASTSAADGWSHDDAFTGPADSLLIQAWFGAFSAEQTPERSLPPKKLEQPNESRE
jgi:hypothetical protein